MHDTGQGRRGGPARVRPARTVIVYPGRVARDQRRTPGPDRGRRRGVPGREAVGSPGQAPIATATARRARVDPSATVKRAHESIDPLGCDRDHLPVVARVLDLVDQRDREVGVRQRAHREHAVPPVRYRPVRAASASSSVGGGTSSTQSSAGPAARSTSIWAAWPSENGAVLGGIVRRVVHRHAGCGLQRAADADCHQPAHAGAGQAVDQGPRRRRGRSPPPVRPAAPPRAPPRRGRRRGPPRRPPTSRHRRRRRDRGTGPDPAPPR